MNDDQIKNAIEAIQSRLYSATSPAELAKLGMAASGLLSFTNSPELENRVKAIQADVEKRIEEVESSISSQNISSNIKENYQEDRDKDLDHIAEAAAKIYEKFRLTSKEDLASKKEDTKNFSELEEAMKGDKPISEDLKKKLRKTPEQIKLERERDQERIEVEKIAEEEAKIRAANIERLRREADRLPPHERTNIQAQIDKETARQAEALSVVGEVREHYDERLKHVESIHNAKEAAQKSGADQTVVNDVEEQFLAAMNGVTLERVIKHAEEKGDGNKEHIKQLKSKQMLVEAVSQDPEVIKAVPNAVKRQQTKPEIVDFSKPLHPTPTPNVAGSLPSKGPGGLGT